MDGSDKSSDELITREHRRAHMIMDITWSALRASPANRRDR
jgi:hypothetical protein